MYFKKYCFSGLLVPGNEKWQILTNLGIEVIMNESL